MSNFLNLVILYKNLLNSVKKNGEISQILSRCKSTGSSNINHYEILNLKPNCDSKDIRIAFLKLSKIYHPDVKKSIKDPNATAKFIRIQEAYQVLQKRSSRAAYDNQLSTNQQNINDIYGCYYNVGGRYTDFNGKTDSYYGVDGIKKVSNTTILWILMIFIALIMLFEFHLFKNSMETNRTRLDEISKAANITHEVVRSEAIEHGNKKQLEKITKRLLGEL